MSFDSLARGRFDGSVLLRLTQQMTSELRTQFYWDRPKEPERSDSSPSVGGSPHLRGLNRVRLMDIWLPETNE